MRKRLGRFLITVLFSLALTCPAHAADETKAFEFLNYYFDLVQSQNFESACGLWEPSCQDRANRMGIEYDNIPVKIDVLSPVINDMAGVRTQLFGAVKNRAVIDSGVVRLRCSFVVGVKEKIWNYQARRLGRDFWLVFPQDIYCADWIQKESKYIRFYINPEMDPFFNDLGAAELDGFIEKTAAGLGVSSARLKKLEQMKLEYYFSAGEAEIQKITGAPVRGYYDLAADAIITADFPDFYMTARFMINFALQKLPPFTVAALTEGMAMYLGGRWQRSPEVIVDFGEYILDNKLTELDSALYTDPGLTASLADITYPIDACLVQFLMEKRGKDSLLALYKTLSGDGRFADTVSEKYIKTTLAFSQGLDWPSFRESFYEHMKTRKSSGGLIYPGEISGGKTAFSNDEITIKENDKSLQVIFNLPAGEHPQCHLLFRKEPALEGKRSALFEEQYKNSRTFEGYRYGIMVDANEIGLYDYGSNQLLAKYVHAFDPSPEYFNSGTNRVTAYFDRKLVRGKLPTKDGFVVLK